MRDHSANCTSQLCQKSMLHLLILPFTASSYYQKYSDQSFFTCFSFSTFRIWSSHCFLLCALVFGAFEERVLFTIIGRSQLSSSYFTYSSSSESEQSTKVRSSYLTSQSSSYSSFLQQSCQSSSFWKFQSLTSYLMPSSSLALLSILHLLSLSLNRQYQPLLKLKSSLPGICKSSIICLACLRICFLRRLGLLTINSASRCSIYGQSALLPPSFFLSSLVWYHRVMFLGCIPSSLAFILISLDSYFQHPLTCSLIDVTSFFLNSMVQLLQVIEPLRWLGLQPQCLTLERSLLLSLLTSFMSLASRRSSLQSGLTISA